MEAGDHIQIYTVLCCHNCITVYSFARVPLQSLSYDATRVYNTYYAWAETR